VKRKPTRLPEYDYSLAGGYFVTLVTCQRNCIFGEIEAGNMQLNRLGEIVHAEWLRTPKIRAEVSLDAFIVMPNHFHAILFLNDVGTTRWSPDDSARQVGATGRSPLHKSRSGPMPRSLGAIIAGFKAAVTTKINTLERKPGRKIWQRNYYDHIIRNPKELDEIRLYIEANPLNWHQDEENPLKHKHP
jgi:REP element-mobilizing transposase RayT